MVSPVDHDGQEDEVIKDEWFRCVREGQVESVPQLLDQRADIDGVTEDGETALQLAAGLGQSHVVNFLLQRRANVDVADLFGFTPLHVAASEGHFQVVNALLDAGADPTLKDNQGGRAEEWALNDDTRVLVARARAQRVAVAERAAGKRFVSDAGGVDDESCRQAALGFLSRRCKELMETEEEMLHQIGRLLTNLDTISSDGSLSELEAKMICLFADKLRAMRRLHDDIRRQLANCDGRPSQLSTVFRNQELRRVLVPVHAEYNYNAQRVLALLQRRFEGGEASSWHDLLVRPTQRVVRYQLFFQDMQRDADRGGPLMAHDTQELESAVVAIQGLLHAINEKRKLKDAADSVIDIQSRLIDLPQGQTLSAPGRRYLDLEGEFEMQGALGNRYLYLFNDAILETKRSFAGHKYKELHSIKTLTPETCPTMIILPDRQPQFILNGKVFSASKATIGVWVTAIAAAVLALHAESTEPVCVADVARGDGPSGRIHSRLVSGSSVHVPQGDSANNGGDGHPTLYVM